MPSLAPLYVANDNDPLHIAPQGDVVGFRALVANRQREFLDLKQYAPPAPTQTGPLVLTLGLTVMVWALALIGLGWAFLTQQGLGVKLICTIAAIWTGLWLAYIAYDHKGERFAELGILGAICGFTALLVTATTQVGLPLTLSEGITIFAASTLLLALFLRSQTSLLCSVLAVLAWAALFIDGYLLPTTIMAAIPVLILCQLALSFWHRAKAAHWLAAFCIYVWLAGLGYQEYLEARLSLLFLTAGLFVLASAHFRLAKAGEVTTFGAMTPHLAFSWTVSACTLIAFQHFLIFPMDFVWSSAFEVSPLNMAVWTGLCILVTGLIALSGFLRRYYARMFISSIILMTGLTALIPLVLWQHDFTINYIETSFGLPAYPMLAALLAGIVCASAVFFCMNNIRRRRYGSSLLGIGVLAVQLYLVNISPTYRIENILVATTGFVVSLCIIILLGHINEFATAQNVDRQMGGEDAG